MQNHSHRVLEFDKIKQKIAENSFLVETQEAIEQLMPIRDINYLRLELKKTNEIAELQRYDGGLELRGIADIDYILDKIHIIGAMLEAKELYKIKENMRVFRTTKNKLSETQDKYKNLFNEFKDGTVLKDIEKMIEKSVDEDGNIKDEASIELKDLRRSKRDVNNRIKDKLNEIISKPTLSKALQERIVTMREGRYVVPVKSDFKGQIKGIEHDRSASGVTVFIEPMVVVSLNNRIRELETKEREEIRKILLRFTDIIRNNIDIINELKNHLKRIDILNSKGLFANKLSCCIPKINENGYSKFVEAKHPLIPENEVVPLSFEIGKNYNIMLITGPNTGGKTVTLKTAGLLTLMATSGMPIPANERSEISTYKNILADIGDEQSIEQNLSSFSAHLKNINNIVNETYKESLILLDELGSGTDPIEGSAFAMAVIDFLKDKKSKAIVTTHYSEVKAYAYNTKGIETASMEFNAETLSPTYRLLLGIPGKSNALTIARKINFPKHIIDVAEKYISDEDKKVESMILNIQNRSEELEKRDQILAEKEQVIRELKEKFEMEKYQAEEEKEKIMHEAYKRADQIVKEIQAKTDALAEKMKKEENRKEDVKQTQKHLSMLRNAMEKEKQENLTEKKIMKKPVKKIKLKPGEEVFVKSLNQKAIVLKSLDGRDEVQIQAGILKMNVSFSDIEKIGESKKKGYTQIQNVRKERVKNEIDIRGKNIEESIPELDIYLDKAILNGHAEVYIIHGKGTGKLRKGIQTFLKTSQYVDCFRDGNMNEGGLGVTVAKLKG